MHALFVDRKSWGRKAWLCERAHRNCDMLFVTFDAIVYGGTAVRTEAKRCPGAVVAYANVLLGVPGDGDASPRKASLSAIRAAGPTLAGQAMANRNANRFLSCCSGELATSARCNAFDHRDNPVFVAPNV
jgi:hypothetical protein